MRKSLRLLLLTAFLIPVLLLSACIKQRGLSTVGVGEVGPIFCFSSGAKCDEKGDEVHSIYVDEVDRKGNSVGMVWLLHGASDIQADYIIKRVEYGKVPHGWKEKEPSQPIKSNTYYSVNGEFFFMRDGKEQYHVETRKEFFDKVQRAMAHMD